MRWPWARARQPERTPLRWIEVDASATGTHPTAVTDLFERRVDGFTVHGVLTPEECATAIEGLDRTGDDQVETMFGTVLGPPVAMRPDPDPGPEDRSGYLATAERCAARYVEAFGFDPFDRVRAAIEPMAEGREVAAPVERGRRYLPGNVRWYQPGRGGLPAHVGNEFPMHQDPSLWYLRQQANTLDHISWFVVLQPPEVGGELSVFDLLFEDEAPELEAWGNQGRHDLPMDAVPATRISPPAGSMIFFGGGWRWHRVEPIGGTIPRMTYGGFACRAKDDRAVYVWI